MKFSESSLLLAFTAIFIGLVSCQQRSKETPYPPFISDVGLVSDERSAPTLPAEDNKLHFDHVTLEDGLSQSTTTSIVQDDQGFMWFGTSNGLNRYDGYEITVFKHIPSDSNSLSDNLIQTLFVDSSGTMWIGMEGGGLERFVGEKEQFEHYKNDPDDSSSISSNFVYSIHEDRSGTLWVGTLNGLNKYDPSSDAFVLHQIEPNPSDDSASTNFILAIHDDPSGVLWLGTAGGLLTFDPRTGEFDDKPLPPRY
ncbi:MAG TPA: two-component regulator propeller domain-containing protein, partial [candidate division Zixibacteria bacterium]|nr:two-component regulator propeller domain-containing protein [candidate division Zixibacteria bacterium]